MLEAGASLCLVFAALAILFSAAFSESAASASSFELSDRAMKALVKSEAAVWNCSADSLSDCSASGMILPLSPGREVLGGSGSFCVARVISLDATTRIVKVCL